MNGILARAAFDTDPDLFQPPFRPVWYFWLGAIVFLGLGALFHAQQRRARRGARAIEATWARVPVTVVSSTVREIGPGEGHEGNPAGGPGFSLSVERERAAPGCVADVRYVYDVRGARVEATGVAPVRETTRAGAEAIVARYPVGARVVAWVNPASPGEAVLELTRPRSAIKSSAWTLVALYGIGLAFLLTAVGIWAPNPEWP